jgi:hypothetical protein
MINPSFHFNGRDYAKMARAGIIIFFMSLLDAARNLIGVLCLITLGLLKVLKIIE